VNEFLGLEANIAERYVNTGGDKLVNPLWNASCAPAPYDRAQVGIIRQSCLDSSQPAQRRMSTKARPSR